MTHMITPIFRIFDVEKAKTFYLDFLGFQLDWEHRYKEGLPLYCQVSLNDAMLHLSEHHADATPGSSIRISVENIKGYHDAISKKEYAYVKPFIEDDSEDMLEMTVIDPFSNRITFYEEIG